MKRIPLTLALGLSLPVLTLLPATAQTVVNTAAPAPATAAPAGIAAEVNDDKILRADLNRLVDSIKAQEPSFSTGTPQANKALAEMRGQVLDELIVTKLLAQEAKRRKITVNTKQVDDAVASIKSGFQTEAEFNAALKKDGKSAEDLRKAIADELTIRELSTQLSADVTVTAEDIGAYYRSHLDQFTIPEGVKARHILLAINPNAPATEKERVKKRALDLIAQLNKKADFAALAKANSDDPSNKDSGGDLGAFTRGQMVKQFEDAAFGATVGKPVGPIETQFGMHIIRVDQKIPAKTLTLAEVQADPQISSTLKANLLKSKVQKRLDDSIAKLKASAKIKKYA